MKVEQYEHANQFHIYDYTHEDYNVDTLQSYNSLVVKIESNNTDYNKLIVLGFDWDYSLTTARHVYDFLEEYGDISFDGVSNKKAYINKLIEDGTIQYDWSMK